MRSRHSAALTFQPPLGIISACAEQTQLANGVRLDIEDHLRVCGADSPCWPSSCSRWGSSPRVRSRRRLGGLWGIIIGIISACAEQTSWFLSFSCCLRDHLRVCGADLARVTSSPYRMGSSPRVRSRRNGSLPAGPEQGIISACAEQTPVVLARQQTRPDHLRVCGADSLAFWNGTHTSGSSPRVRSRLQLRKGRGMGHGIISACAEQTGRQCR